MSVYRGLFDLEEDNWDEQGVSIPMCYSVIVRRIVRYIRLRHVLR